MREELLDNSVSDRQDEGDAKIINTTVGAIPASLLIRLDADTTIDSAATESLFGVEDCIGYRKVLYSDMADDELAVRKGLDRWFEVRLDENADLRAMAEYFASCGQVEIVQFDTKPVPASDCRSLPYRPAARQFSSGNASTAFNDPMLPDQWHFKNTGNTGVTPTVKAGADINVTDAWRIVAGDPGVIVAVVDGGVQYDHPDLAAGNEGLHMSAYPAALVDCISVTSFAADGLPAYYTCYGPGCNIAAPGGEYCTGGVDRKHEQTLVLSTMPTVSLLLYDSFGNQNGTSAKDYGYMQGTSMACPHVSGIVALGLVSAPEVSEDGLLRIEPTRAGSAKMTIRAIAGGSSMGGGNSIGGSEILREVSVISRNVVSGNGGWL